ncbi:MAG: helix-turn-helix domain-containing protein [Erysipelotrichaceae bacterium]|nr:helix-turn-helix domain-containing protein [Erysipelotrichaceae bacterium]
MSLYHDQAAMLIKLFEAKEPVKASVFSQMYGIGLKTVKKEIEAIDAECNENGCNVRSKTGDGYFLEVSDEESYQLFKEEVRKKYYGNFYYRNEKSERMHLAIRLILVQGRMFIDDLAYRCLCSQSTLNRDMKRIKDRLKEYKLDLVNRTNQGLTLEGDEWHIRLAMIEEYELYNTFEQVAHFEEEKEFHEAFMHQGIYHDLLFERIFKVLKKHNYAVPYFFYDRMADMIVLTMTRKRYASHIDELLPWFNKCETERVEPIIAEIFADLPGFVGVDLSAGELKALALYLKLHHTLKYNQLREKEDPAKADAMVEDLLAKLNERIDMRGYDLTSFIKDLFCELSRLTRQLAYDVHLPRYYGKNFARDGVLSLDICTFIYRYLLDHGVKNLLEDDILSFYYIVSSMVRNCASQHKKRIYVISSQGFYASRSYATNLRRMISSDSLEFVPVEYFELYNTNMSQVDCILTDIESLQNEFYYKPVYDLFYARKAKQLERLQEQIMEKEYPFFEDCFKAEDIAYPEGLSNVKEIEKYLLDNCLEEKDDRQLISKELANRYELVDPKRNNQIILLNTVGDFIGRDIFKVLIFKKPLGMQRGDVDKVIFYNIKEPTIDKMAYLSRHIANLIHTDKLELSYDSQKDHETILNILQSSSK